MKTQNLFYGLLIVLLFMGTACSNNDEGATKTLSEKVVGTWKPVKDVYVCSIGSNEIEIVSNCEQSGRLVITNESFKISYYDDFGGTCVLNDGYEGTWEIVDEKLIVNAFGGDIEDNVEITFFEITGNILRMGQYDEYFLCDGNMPSSHNYREYIKI